MPFQENAIQYVPPYIVNGAFSIELALKSILCENKVDYKREHNLYQLFRLLPNTFQNEIKLVFEQLDLSYDMGNFDKDFVLISDSFVEWRYAFEAGTAILHSGVFNRLVTAIAQIHFNHYKADFFPAPSPTKKEVERLEQEIEVHKEKKWKKYFHKEGQV